MREIPIEAHPFEDFIDGYFPLDRSLRHLLDRRGFVSAWVTVRVAPMMQVAGLADRDPVPLHITPETEGQIEWLATAIRCEGETTSVSGFAKWHWNEPSRNQCQTLSSEIRLSEPAFVRGFGFVPGTLQTRTLGAVRSAKDTSIVNLVSQETGNKDFLDFADCSFWHMDPSNGFARFHPKFCRRQSESMGLDFDERQEVLAFRSSDDPLDSRILTDSHAF